MNRIYIRSALLPLLQAVLTAASTASGVLLVLWLRPDWHRRLPFYSDASHNDPERIILAAGENLACALGPPAAVAEYLQHVRLAQHTPTSSEPAAAASDTHAAVPAQRLQRVRLAVRANFLASLATTPFFFLVANVPSRYPATRLHQFSASVLILCYAVQASLKLYLYHALTKPHVSSSAAHEPSDDVERGSGLADGPDKAPKPALQQRQRSHGHAPRRTVPVALRVFPVFTLWTVLLGSFVCFAGRVAVKAWGPSWQPVRDGLALSMALLAHSATFSCVVVMGVLAADLRGELVVLSGLH